MMPLRSLPLMSHAQLGKIVEGSASEIYIFCAINFNFWLVNQGARENLGYSVEELSQLTPWHLKPLIDEAGFRSLVQPLLTGDARELTFETVHRRKDKSEYDVSVHLELLRSGESDVFFAAIRDVTREKRLNAEIELKAKELEEALAAKEVLLKEVNHRVKNSLQVVTSLLKLQSRQVGDPSLKSVLVDAQNRVSVVAKIHQKLYSASQHDRVDFAELLDELTDQIVEHMIIGEYIEIEKHLEPDIQLGIDIAVPLTLMIAEILTNSVKYAFPAQESGTIRLRLYGKGKKLHVRIEDDGIGLPAPFGSEETRGLGTMIINSLSKQIRANVSVESGPGGTAFQLELPREAKGR